ncbi:MAG: HNH endonuclease [Proteobacteria bacterium]|nr:HNH endonuclease [Pseudomonadota bacterium]
MATYLFTWNPDRWDWQSLEEDNKIYRQSGFLDSRWSCGVTKRIVPGDRAFLIKLGREEPRGIIASGYSLSAPFEAPHYSDPAKTANYIHLRYDVLLNPGTEELLDSYLLAKELPDVRWSPQGSGISIAPEAAFRLEELWRNHISIIGLNPQENADEVLTPERYSEGAIRRISVNAYERDPRARKACIAYHGTSCMICGFSFARNFGDIGKGFIHVHHLRPLADIGEEYEVNPVTDLIPLCPNCHAMIHRKNPPYSPQELAVSLRAENSDIKN